MRIPKRRLPPPRLGKASAGETIALHAGPSKWVPVMLEMEGSGCANQGRYPPRGGRSCSASIIIEFRSIDARGARA